MDFVSSKPDEYYELKYAIRLEERLWKNMMLVNDRSRKYQSRASLNVTLPEGDRPFSSSLTKNLQTANLIPLRFKDVNTAGMVSAVPGPNPAQVQPTTCPRYKPTTPYPIGKRDRTSGPNSLPRISHQLPDKSRLVSEMRPAKITHVSMVAPVH